MLHPVFEISLKKHSEFLLFPGPFMPCEDLFGWWSLRCGVWVVFLLAMLGNGVVVVVLLFGRSKIDVPRFLVCNLALADFFMGIYLGILAVVDASTLGEFRVRLTNFLFSSKKYKIGNTQSTYEVFPH